MWTPLLAAGLAGALLFLYIKLYNQLKRLSVKVAEGSAGINVALEKRYDMLSNELEAVKKFLAHEHQVYTEVTALRTGTALDQAAFEAKKVLSEQAAAAIGNTIQEQQAQMQALRQKLEQQRTPAEGLGADAEDGGLTGRLTSQQISLDRKLEMLSSVQQGLHGVNSAINALTEQYPVLQSYISIHHFQRDIFDAEEHLQAARRLYNANVSLYNQKLAAFPYSVIARIHGMQAAEFYTVDEQKKEFQVKF